VRNNPYAGEILGFVGAMVCMCALMLFGCSGKVSPEAAAALNLAAVTAKESATSYDVIRDQITAKDEADAAAILEWRALHGTGLNAEAAGLALLSDTVKKHGKLSDTARAGIGEEAQTAKAHAEVFRAQIKRVALNEKLAAWADAHQERLDAQAAVIDKLAKLLKPPEPAQK
jgi:hypothetical protein